MNIKRFLIIPMLLSILLATGCPPSGSGGPESAGKQGQAACNDCCADPERPKGTVLVDMGQDVITVEELDDEIGRLNKRIRDRYRTPDMKRQFLTNLINKKLLYRAAKKKGLDKSESVREEMAKHCQRILVNELWKTEIDRLLTDEKLKEYYDEHIDEFTDDLIPMSHIMIAVQPRAMPKEIAQKRKEADRIAKLAAKPGADFAALARQYSEDKKTKDKGGDLGKVSEKSRLFGSPEFWRKALKMKPGEVSTVPIKTPRGGFHIIKVTGQKERAPLPFDENIKRRIKSRQRSKVISQYMADLRQQAKVVIKEELLGISEQPAGDEKTAPTRLPPTNHPGGLRPMEKGKMPPGHGGAPGKPAPEKKKAEPAPTGR